MDRQRGDGRKTRSGLSPDLKLYGPGTIEGAPHLKPEHLPVFDCSFRPQNGSRSIHYMGHVRMMAAVQPFISGAISKTARGVHRRGDRERLHRELEARAEGGGHLSG